MLVTIKLQRIEAIEQFLSGVEIQSTITSSRDINGRQENNVSIFGILSKSLELISQSAYKSDGSDTQKVPFFTKTTIV